MLNYNPQSVVQDFGPRVGDELIAQRSDLAIHDKPLEIQMSGKQLLNCQGVACIEYVGKELTIVIAGES